MEFENGFDVTPDILLEKVDVELRQSYYTWIFVNEVGAELMPSEVIVSHG
jgi:hypothetical protein